MYFLTVLLAVLVLAAKSIYGVFVGSIVSLSTFCSTGFVSTGFVSTGFCSAGFSPAGCSISNFLRLSSQYSPKPQGRKPQPSARGTFLFINKACFIKTLHSKTAYYGDLNYRVE